MARTSVVTVLLSSWLFLRPVAAEEPEGLRDRFLARIKAELNQLPDFVCRATVERFSRTGAEQSWQKIDTLRLDMAVVGEREMYSLAGGRGFDSRPLVNFVTRGTIGNGQLALLARHVFLTSAATLTYREETEQDGHAAYEYAYDVPREHSSYHLRLGVNESTVPFQGRFWIDRATLDLIELDVQAYDIPESLGIAEADTELRYARAAFDGANVLLPDFGTLTVVATNGDANMNRSRIDSCRHYRADSAITFAVEQPVNSGESDRTVPEARPMPTIPSGAEIELALDAPIDPAIAKVGDTVRAVVVRDIKNGETVVVPKGAEADFQLVRLNRTAMPFPVYEIGLAFEDLSISGHSLAVTATMQRAPTRGLVKRSKSLDPTFSRERVNRLKILVPEVKRGEGMLEWDARKGAVPAGLRMKWRVDGARSTPPENAKAPGVERKNR